MGAFKQMYLYSSLHTNLDRIVTKKMGGGEAFTLL